MFVPSLTVFEPKKNKNKFGIMLMLLKATVLENVQDITRKSEMTTTTLAGFIVNCPFFSVDTVYAHMK